MAHNTDHYTMIEEARGYALGAHYHLNEPFSLAIKFRLRGGRFMLVHLVPAMINAFAGGTFKALSAAKRMETASAAATSIKKEPVSLTSEEVSSIDETTAVIRAAVAYRKKGIVATLRLKNHTEVQINMDESLAVILAGTITEEGSKFFNGGSMVPPSGSKLQ